MSWHTDQLSSGQVRSLHTIKLGEQGAQGASRESPPFPVGGSTPPTRTHIRRPIVGQMSVWAKREKHGEELRREWSSWWALTAQWIANETHGS